MSTQNEATAAVAKTSPRPRHPEFRRVYIGTGDQKPVQCVTCERDPAKSRDNYVLHLPDESICLTCGRSLEACPRNFELPNCISSIVRSLVQKAGFSIISPVTPLGDTDGGWYGLLAENNSATRKYSCKIQWKLVPEGQHHILSKTTIYEQEAEFRAANIPVDLDEVIVSLSQLGYQKQYFTPMLLQSQNLTLKSTDDRQRSKRALDRWCSVRLQRVSHNGPPTNATYYYVLFRLEFSWREAPEQDGDMADAAYRELHVLKNRINRFANKERFLSLVETNEGFKSQYQKVCGLLAIAEEAHAMQNWTEATSKCRECITAVMELFENCLFSS